jgi:hypothetical protein
MDSRSLLAALQHADSFFPSGAVSFSWGLEALRADGLVRTANDVALFIAGLLRHRWATGDRPLLAAAPAMIWKRSARSINSRKRWRMSCERGRGGWAPRSLASTRGLALATPPPTAPGLSLAKIISVRSDDVVPRGRGLRQ